MRVWDDFQMNFTELINKKEIFEPNYILVYTEFVWFEMCNINNELFRKALLNIVSFFVNYALYGKGGNNPK